MTDKPKDEKTRAMLANALRVESRYGKTLGDSKGSKPAPDGKVKPKIRRDSVSVTYKKEF